PLALIDRMSRRVTSAEPRRAMLWRCSVADTKLTLSPSIMPFHIFTSLLPEIVSTRNDVDETVASALIVAPFRSRRVPFGGVITEEQSTVDPGASCTVFPAAAAVTSRAF